MHQIANRASHFGKKRLGCAEQASVTDGAAHNFPEDIAASFIGWQDAIADEESCGAGVVCDDT